MWEKLVSYIIVKRQKTERKPRRGLRGGSALDGGYIWKGEMGK